MELDYVKELKSDKKEAPMIEINLQSGYKIRVVYRGEGLFYHDFETDKALVFDIQIRNGSIFESTIKKWDDSSKISQKERDIILERTKLYFHNFQKIDSITR